MDKKNYFVFKYLNLDGLEFWDTSLYSSSELNEAISHSLSIGLTVIGVKQIVLD